MLSCAPNTYTSIHKLGWCGSIFYNLEGMNSTTIKPSTRGMSCLSCHALWSSLEWTISASLRFENSAKIPWLKPLARAGAKFGPALTCTTPLNLAPENHKRYEHGKINVCKDSKKIWVWHMWKKLCRDSRRYECGISKISGSNSRRLLFWYLKEICAKIQEYT